MEKLVNQMANDLLSDGVSIQSMGAFSSGTADGLWKRIGELPARADGGLRRHAQIRRQFEDFNDLSATLGAAGDTARELASALSDCLGGVATRLAEMGLVPQDIISDPSWAANITRWLPSGDERLPMHVDWEMLSFVLSPDGCLETDNGQQPDGPVAILVAGDLCTRYSNGKIRGGGHRVTAGPTRRSFQTFYLGNPSVCFGHGRLTCDCGPSMRQVLKPRYDAEATDFSS
jgi:hypothetical protein